MKMLEDFVNAANSADKLSYPIISDEHLSIQTIRGREVIAIEFPRAEREQRPIYEGRDPFKGTYRLELEWSGNLFDFYERAYEKLRQALEVPFKLDGIRRVDETPAHEALREAIVNALSNALCAKEHNAFYGKPRFMRSRRAFPLAACPS